MLCEYLTALYRTVPYCTVLYLMSVVTPWCFPSQTYATRCACLTNEFFDHMEAYLDNNSK